VKKECLPGEVLLLRRYCLSGEVLKQPIHSRMTYTTKLQVTGFLFILPVVLYFLFVYYVPLFTSFAMSFTEVLPKKVVRFAGLETYREVLSDVAFWESVRNTLFFNAISIMLVVPFGIIIAVGIYNLSSSMMRNMFTALYILPIFVSFAAAGAIWEWIYHPHYGIINNALAAIGGPRFSFLTSPEQVVPSLAVINFWVRAGYCILIILSGLQSIPHSYFEAARMDGASGISMLRKITLPLLLPQITVVTLLEFVFGFKVFDVVYVTTQGGPARASYMMLFYFYDNAFRFYRQDRASVVAVLMFVMLLIFSIIQRRIVKGKRYEF
jgi:multiple sugar transport system permease protein